MSGGAGASYQWSPFEAGLPPLPPNQAQGGIPARVVTPCREFLVREGEYVSIWLPRPMDWPGEDTDLRAEAAQMIFMPDNWDIYNEEIFSFDPAASNSRLQLTAIPEETSLWRQDNPHWIGPGLYIAVAGVAFREVEGVQQVQWHVYVDSYQCYIYLILLPPIPPVPPGVPGAQSGHGHGSVLGILPGMDLFPGLHRRLKKA